MRKIMKLNFVIMGAAVAALFTACDKEPQTFTGPQAEGRFTFQETELNVQVTPSTKVLSIPIRLTRRDYSKSLTANVSVSERNTTAIVGEQFQLFSVTGNDQLDGCYTVAEMAPGDSTALFPILLAPEQITSPVTVELALLDTYYPIHMDEIIRTLTIHLNPAQ